MWIYNSPIGLMMIRPKEGRYLLWIKNELCGSYSSPAKAADDVASFTTGCFEWDHLAYRISNYPADITEWDVR